MRQCRGSSLALSQAAIASAKFPTLGYAAQRAFRCVHRVGGYGLLLLLVPAAASVFWPWKLDTFHAQLYSVTFLAPAVGAGVLLRGATRSELKTLGLTLAAWGLLPIIGLVLADASVHRVRWAITDTWLWLALFSGMTGVGAWLAVHSRKTAWQEILRRQEEAGC